MRRVSVECDAAEIASIKASGLDSYIPMLEIALVASDPAGAARALLEKTADFSSTVADLPCDACFLRLAPACNHTRGPSSLWASVRRQVRRNRR